MPDMESDAPEGKTAKTVLAALMVALSIKMFVLDFMIAEGDSMSPTIASGTVLVVNLAAYGLRLPFSGGYLIRWGSLREGDIVVFPSPRGSIAVKRCARLLDGGTFFALGDNTEASYDSRSYGSVSVDAVIGKVLGYK